MFPRHFKATVDQRLALWGATLGIVACLYGATEFIGAERLAGFSQRLASHTTALDLLATSAPAYQRLIDALHIELGGSSENADLASLASVLAEIAVALPGDVADEANEARQMITEIGSLAGAAGPAAADTLRRSNIKRNELRVALTSGIATVSRQLAAHLASSRQNKILLSLLGLFLVVLIVTLEYRWLVKPMIGMARTLGSGDNDQSRLDKLAMRRDEVGMLGRALTAHLREERTRTDAASSRLATLSDEIARQERLQAQSRIFQDRIGAIAAAIEQNAARMSGASGDLARLSSFVDERASAAAQSTQRASAHVDNVAGSIAEVSRLSTNTAVEARTTSAVADDAKSLVAAAAADNAALARAVASIDQVLDIIGSVASKTNLLALNATIEAAHAGEAGRGFAVVASEVKQLASRTAEATEEVRRGLASVRSAAAGMSERVGALVISVDQVEGAAATISGLAHAQETSSRAISDSTAQTAGDVRSAAEQVGQLAGMVEDWRRTGDSVTLASSDLERQAAELRRAVDGFFAQTQDAVA